MAKTHGKFSSPRTRPFKHQKSRPHQFEHGQGKSRKGKQRFGF